MRSTSAPQPARKRVAMGPARTRVRSRTRIPWSGRSGVEDIVESPESSVARIASSGSRLTLSPCAWVTQVSFDRIAAAQPFLRRSPSRAHRLSSWPLRAQPRICRPRRRAPTKLRRDGEARWCAIVSTRQQPGSRPRWNPRPPAATNLQAEWTTQTTETKAAGSPSPVAPTQISRQRVPQPTPLRRLRRPSRNPTPQKRTEDHPRRRVAHSRQSRTRSPNHAKSLSGAGVCLLLPLKPWLPLQILPNAPLPPFCPFRAPLAEFPLSFTHAILKSSIGRVFEGVSH